MEESVQEQEVMMTSRFKPPRASFAARQRQKESDIVDDWDAQSSDDDTPTDNAKAAEPNRERTDVFRASKDQWTEANSHVPAAMPIVATSHGRSLPVSAFGPRLETRGVQPTNEAHSSTLKPHSGGMVASAPPRILQRPKDAAPGMRSDGTFPGASILASQDRKTIEQRQEEYRLARQRIFGPLATTPTGKNSSSKGQ